MKTAWTPINFRIGSLLLWAAILGVPAEAGAQQQTSSPFYGEPQPPRQRGREPSPPHFPPVRDREPFELNSAPVRTQSLPKDANKTIPAAYLQASENNASGNQIVNHPSSPPPFHISEEKGAPLRNSSTGSASSKIQGEDALSSAKQGSAAETLRLPGRGEKSSSESKPESKLLGSSIPGIVGSLGIVSGTFCIAVWLMRRGGGVMPGKLPKEVLEILGRAPMPGKQQLYLMRCGRKLLLLSVSPVGTETLTEITDPEEVDHLAGICLAAQPQSASKSFLHVFQQFGEEKTEAGFLGAAVRSNLELAAGGSVAGSTGRLENGNG